MSKISTENFQVLQLKKNLYITWASFGNVILQAMRSTKLDTFKKDKIFKPDGC